MTLPALKSISSARPSENLPRGKDLLSNEVAQQVRRDYQITPAAGSMGMRRSTKDIIVNKMGKTKPEKDAAQLHDDVPSMARSVSEAKRAPASPPSYM